MNLQSLFKTTCKPFFFGVLSIVLVVIPAFPDRTFADDDKAVVQMPELAPEMPDEPSEPTVVQKDIVLPKYSKAIGGSGKNLAYDKPSPTIEPGLTEHSRKMEQRIYQTAGNVYCAVGYGIADMTMIEGTDGIIIVDPLEALEVAREVMAEFRKITDKPVKAIIYTHNHYDHVMGVQAVVTPEDVASGKVPIFAHERLMECFLKQLSVVGLAIGTRSAYMFGHYLGKGPEGSVNEGAGPLLVYGTPTFIPPTRTFKDKLEIEIAGIQMQLLYAPSETDDQIVIWFPRTRVLHTAEVIQGESFPNLYSIRGTTYRDPVKWYKTIDMLRELGAEYMVPSHGRPIEGKAEVDSLLTAYRDAIQYAHDQAVRLINKGYTPDELAEALPGLPSHLATHPWLGEFYGSVKHAVRNFYVGYLGWFEGDPTFLDPLPRSERAARYVKQMGGRKAMLKAAQGAFDANDYRWAAELLTYVIRVNREDKEARDLKAKALRQLGLKQMNVTWRNFYLTAALELEDKLDQTRKKISGPAIIASLPVSNILESMTVRIDPEKSKDMHMTLVFHITDKNEDYGLEIRRGVVQFYEKRPPQADLTVSMPDKVLREIVVGETTFKKGMDSGIIKLEGKRLDLYRFFRCFDMAQKKPISLAVR